MNFPLEAIHELVSSHVTARIFSLPLEIGNSLSQKDLIAACRHTTLLIPLSDVLVTALPLVLDENANLVLSPEVEEVEYSGDDLLQQNIFGIFVVYVVRCPNGLTEKLYPKGGLLFALPSRKIIFR